MLTRRRILHVAGAATLAGLAGCLNGTDRNDPPTDNDTSTGYECDLPSDGDMSENEPGDTFPMITIEPDDSELEGAHFTGNVIRHFDDDGPAQLQITFLNNSNEEQQFTFLDSAPFPAYTGFHSDGETGLFIGPESGYQIDESDEPTDGCWHIDDVPPINDIEDVVDLDPCETVTETYNVYHSTGEDCLKEGKYRFEVADVGAQGHE